MAKRMLTYKQDFLALGFIEIKDRSGVPRPQCVVCMQLLSNESLKINKLKRHLEKVHPTYANKPLAFWKEKETQAKRMRLDAPSSSATVSLEKTTYASFEVALKVAQCKKPHSIAEQLIKPAAIAMARTVCGDEIAKKLEIVPISNDTVKKRIDLMSLDILEQLITDLKKAIKFSIQIDESVDIEDFPQLLVYVRYRTPQNFNEEFLFCEKLSGTTTGADRQVLCGTPITMGQLSRSLYRWSTGNDRESHRVLCQSQGTKSRRCFNTLLFTSRKLGYT